MYLAHQNKVKFQEDDIPFAKDIDYITNRFWFKLKKGFSDKNTLPKSFDVVTKAQIILSSQLNQSVFQEYSKLQKQIKEGSLTKDEAMERSYELREKPNKPEDITIETIDSSLDFLTNDFYFEDIFREKEKKDIILKETLQKNEELQKEIERRDEIERQKKLDLEEEQRNIDKTNFVNDRWIEFEFAKRSDLLYAVKVILLTILPIFIGFIIEGNKSLNRLVECLGNNQYFLWGFLTLVFLAELLGRSYLFNKEKVKSGWHWLNTLLSSSKYIKIKEQKFSDFNKEFESTYKK